MKIDYALAFSSINDADYSIEAEFRLYRDGTLIDARNMSTSGTAAGTQVIDIFNTYVDTAVSTGTLTYDVRVIVTSATNITSADAINRNINAIVFP